MKERVLTASVLAPIVLGAFLVPFHWVAAIILAVFLCLGLIEAAFFHFRKWPKSQIAGVVATLPGLAWMIFGVVRPKEGVLIPFAKFPLVYAALILLGIMCCNIHALRKDSLAFKLLGLLGAYFWVTGGILSFWHLVASQDLSGETVTYPVLLCLLPIWAGDIAAIYAGTRWGKHPMMPSLSPNKTWEGGGANLLSCAILSAITGWVISAPLWISLSCGLTCGVVGQAGDLFESLLKRTAGVKDSGNLLPGHGGILDRIDSLLFAGAGVAALLAVIQ